MGKLKLMVQTTGWLILTILFCSCSQFATQESTAPDTSATLVPSAKTQTSQYTTPIPPTPGSIPTSIASSPVATKPDRHVYLDPEGWYSVKFPADWKENETSASFSGESGFFETGYLPEIGFMSRSLSVCVWLANINAKPEQNMVRLISTSDCDVRTNAKTGTDFIQTIFENPAAGFEHRFVYIKADENNYDRIKASFTWLRPVDVEIEPELQQIPLRPEDISFWENASAMPAGFSINEFVLPPEAQGADPSKTGLSKYIPSGVPSIERIAAAYEKPEINEQLKLYGYALRPGLTGETHSQRLYKDGELLFDNVRGIPNVYTFTTTAGLKVAFVVETWEKYNSWYKSYLIENDIVTEWGDNFRDPNFAPILYKDELLWVRSPNSSHVQVQNSRRDVLFTFATYYGTYLPVYRFTAWNAHWILVVGNFIIQDGEILNEKFGFEETFNWYLINDKPFYFFRKGPRVGISYDGQFLSSYYDSIAHGFG